jgi:hypothetical protein
MQTKIDWTTGGLTFYDVDPPKSEKKEDFTPDYNVNIQFDPVPSSLPLFYIVYQSNAAYNLSNQSDSR